MRHLAPLPARRPVPLSSRQHQGGFTLLQIALVLAMLLSLTFSLIYKSGDSFSKRTALDDTRRLALADMQLQQFVLANGRLPCPSVTANGDESVSGGHCSAQKGYLPYKTLGLVDGAYVFGEVPMLYGVYDNPLSVAVVDRTGTPLVGVTPIAGYYTGSDQVFFPTYDDETNTSTQLDPTNKRNAFDFCALLNKQMSAAYDNTGLGINRSSPVNAVYALAIPGMGARSSGSSTFNGQYDDKNRTDTLLFEAPETPVSDHYDDKTLYHGAADLYEHYRCDSIRQSVTLLAHSVSLQKEVADFASSNKDNATQGLFMDEVNVAINVWGLIQAIADVSSASEVLVESSALLATASALCPLPPWITCALIPVYATAEVNAGVGEGLAVTSAVLWGVSVGLSVASTVLYADIKSRINVDPVVPAASSSVSKADLDAKQAAYVSAKASAVTAYASLSALGGSTEAQLNTAQQAKAALVDTNISGGTDPTLNAALHDRLYGKTTTCVLVLPGDCSGFTLDPGPSNTTKYTRVDVAGIVPAVDGYYAALSLGGAGSPLGVSVPSTPTYDPAGHLVTPATPDAGATTALASGNANNADPSATTPAQALTALQTRESDYGTLLSAVAAFDAANIADATASTAGTQANRASTLATARNALGDQSWTPASSTSSLCSPACSTWMVGAATTGASGTSSGTAGSTTVNDYLTAYGTYQQKKNSQAVIDKARSLANTAWSARNDFKTVLCAGTNPNVAFAGAALDVGALDSNPPHNPLDLGKLDPGPWDNSENLPGATWNASGGNIAVTGLTCGNVAKVQPDSNSMKTKYCGSFTADLTAYPNPPVGGGTYVAKDSGGQTAADYTTLCAQMSTTSGQSRSVIKDADAIMKAVVGNGVAR